MNRLVAAVAAFGLLAVSASADPLPGRLAGVWKIARILPTKNTGCWDQTQAKPLVGSTLMYGNGAMRWQGGEVAVSDVNTRRVSAGEFEKESAGNGDASASFAQLGIHAPAVTEVDLQHEDMDITGATTEVPGDAVLLAGANRIIVSACGVYFEAVRGGGVLRTSAGR